MYDIKSKMNRWECHRMNVTKWPERCASRRHSDKVIEVYVDEMMVTSLHLITDENICLSFIDLLELKVIEKKWPFRNIRIKPRITLWNEINVDISVRLRWRVGVLGWVDHSLHSRLPRQINLAVFKVDHRDRICWADWGPVSYFTVTTVNWFCLGLTDMNLMMSWSVVDLWGSEQLKWLLCRITPAKKLCDRQDFTFRSKQFSINPSWPLSCHLVCDSTV
jgi:hypothetical protein